MDEEKQSDRSPLILFVCKKCGSLCLTFPEFLYNISEEMSPLESSENSIPDVLTYSAHSENQGNWAGSDIFENIMEYSTFPVCKLCATEMIQRINSRIKFITTAESYYSRLDIQAKSVFQETLEQEVECLQGTSDFSSSSDELRKSELEKNAEHDFQGSEINSNENLSTNNNVSSNNYIDKTYNIFSEKKLDDFSRNYIREGCFKSLMLPVVFKIGFKRCFGTINNLRIGQTNTTIVNDDEINQSFFFLAQLIKACGSIVNIDTSQIIIDTKLSMKTAEGAVVVFDVADIKKRRSLGKFNEALEVLFKISGDIFLSEVLKAHSMMPPNLICVEDHTISNICYFVNPKMQNNWTYSMKLLLTNFKFVLTYGLRNAVFNMPEYDDDL